jgi:GTP pyrophosphokinase/guanosine-3',5'-bis(diphosphate) 3'-pyrophosphohydrolase
MRVEGLGLPSLEADDPAAKTWHDLATWAGSAGTEQLLIDIGAGRKIAAIIAKKLARLMAEQGQRPGAVALTLGRYTEAPVDRGSVVIDGSEGASVQLASCCRPIPGDEVRGYLGRGEGLVVHTCECAVGRRLFQRDSEHWIQVDWADELTRNFEAGITLLLNNGKGVLAQVAQAVAQAEADITHIAMGDDAPLRETAEMNLLIAVRDRLHLADVLRVLKRSPAVQRVARVKP